MIGINIDQKMIKFLSDESRKINEDKLNSICKIRQCERSCRYIMMGPIGFICVKNTPLKRTIDQMNIDKQMNAKGDNCDGLGVCLNDVKKESTNKDKEKGKNEESCSKD